MNNKDTPTVDIEKAIKNCYSTWGEVYYDEYYGDGAPYPPVHLNLIKSILNDAGSKRVLDAGCGPASMLRHFLQKGREIYGFDLTPEMVLEAKRVMGQLGVPESHVWEASVLNPSGYFCDSANDDKYDAIVSCGVFPHLREEDEIVAISNIYNSLMPGGLAIVEARNALFSLFALNRHTYEFFTEKLIPVEELRGFATNEENVKLEVALEQLKAQLRTDLPPIRKGKAGELGYDEVLSRLHNPLELERVFKEVGFQEVEVVFYHFHSLPPQFSGSIRNLFLQGSINMEENPRDWRGYFMASAFCVVAKK
ncbi:methyltransferase domain-containing protein [Polynucleobacter sp. MWH-UH19D]|uniref:class I SAM-dependent methyltransferase n=1 Tax=Polynucleobacter sp. MWH-UH19D TaxID=1855610 RepID=UPI003364E8F7